MKTASFLISPAGVVPATPPTRLPRGSEPPIFPQGKDRSIPISVRDLNLLLLELPGWTPEQLRQLEQLQHLLAALLHFEFHLWLDRLKDLYSHLDPDGVEDCRSHRPRRLDESADEDFLKAFEATLIKANYQKLDLVHIQRAVSAPNGFGLNYTPNFEIFEHLNVYVRGRCRIHRKLRDITTLFRLRERQYDAYHRVVVLLKFKPGTQLDEYIRDDVVYLRFYRDVPFAEMDLHLPEQGTKVRMRWLDKAQIASPLITGLPTLAMKLLSAGIFASLSPFALASLLAIPVGASLKSFFGFQNTKKRHLHFMIRHLYYLTLANNSSVLARLIDSAEEEEYKETILAYCLLARHRVGPDSPPLDHAELDQKVERFLLEQLQIETDFEIQDAWNKLVRLGLADRDPQGRLRALPLGEALPTLDARWDALFPSTVPRHEQVIFDC